MRLKQLISCAPLFRFAVNAFFGEQPERRVALRKTHARNALVCKENKWMNTASSKKLVLVQVYR